MGSDVEQESKEKKLGLKRCPLCHRMNSTAVKKCYNCHYIYPKSNQEIKDSIFSNMEKVDVSKLLEKKIIKDFKFFYRFGIQRGYDQHFPYIKSYTLYGNQFLTVYQDKVDSSPVLKTKINSLKLKMQAKIIAEEGFVWD